MTEEELTKKQFDNYQEKENKYIRKITGYDNEFESDDQMQEESKGQDKPRARGNSLVSIP